MALRNGQTGQQFRRTERFGQVIIRPALQSIDFVLFRVPDGKHNDGH
jgi:hypothetical protein